MADILTIAQVAARMATGKRPASLKFALWLAAVSPQKSITQNARAAQVLARYVRHGLPVNPSYLRKQLKRAGAGVVYGSMLDAIYWAQALEDFGILAAYETVPRTYAGWVAWRDGLRAVCKGHGYGYKVLSFAGLLYAPLDCELVPVDRHVLARLGVRTRTGKQPSAIRSKSRYQAIEQAVRDEQAQAGYAHIPTGLYHWLAWEQWREGTGASERHGSGVDDHAALSCCDYW